MIRTVGLAVLLVPLLAGCEGGVASANLPPNGTIWFGASFDTETFEITGRTESVSTTETFAAVANLDQNADGSELNIRIAWNDQQVSNSATGFSGSGDVWGFTYGPLFEPGRWTFELTDIGGNVLASGSVTATE